LAAEGSTRVYDWPRHGPRVVFGSARFAERG
jgi:hypothetical protein